MMIKEILSLMPTLSPQSLKQIREFSAHLLGGKERVPDELQGLEEIHSAVNVELNLHNVTPLPPWTVLRDLKHGPLFDRGAKTWIVLQRRHLPKLNRVERIEFYRIASRSIFSYLSRRHIPRSGRTFCTVMDRLEEALDDSFPGYLTSGLLRMIIRGGFNHVRPQSRSKGR